MREPQRFRSGISSRRFRSAWGVLLLLAAMAGCSKFHKQAAPAAPESDLDGRQVIHLDSTVLNLGDTTDAAYLRLGVSITLAPTPSIDSGSVKSVITSIAHDTIVTTVSSKNSADLLTTHGKDDLKATIMAELQRRVKSPKVLDIYFDEFLVQR